LVRRKVGNPRKYDKDWNGWGIRKISWGWGGNVQGHGRRECWRAVLVHIDDGGRRKGNSYLLPVKNGGKGGRGKMVGRECGSANAERAGWG